KENIHAYPKESTLDCLKNLVFNMIYFRLEHYQLSAFIHRELLLDSTFVKEMSVTYLAKEIYLRSSLFYLFLPESKRKSRRMLYMLLQGRIISPFNLRIEGDITL